MCYRIPTIIGLAFPPRILQNCLLSTCFPNGAVILEGTVYHVQLNGAITALHNEIL